MSTGWGLCVDRAWQNPDHTFLLILKGVLRSGGFHSRRQKSKRIVFGVPGPVEQVGRLAWVVASSPFPKTDPSCSACFSPQSCSPVCLSPQPRCPGAWTAGVGHVQDLRENWQWEEETTHTLCSTCWITRTAAPRTNTGVRGSEWALTDSRPRFKQGSHGRLCGRNSQGAHSAEQLFPPGPLLPCLESGRCRHNILATLLYPWLNRSRPLWRSASLLENQVSHVQTLLPELGHPESNEVELEAGGTAVFPDDQGDRDGGWEKGYTGQSFPKKLTPFPSLERHGKVRHVCEPDSSPCPRSTCRAPEHSRATGRACPKPGSCPSHASAGASVTSLSPSRPGAGTNPTFSARASS